MTVKYGICRLKRKKVKDRIKFRKAHSYFALSLIIDLQLNLFWHDFKYCKRKKWNSNILALTMHLGFLGEMYFISSLLFLYIVQRDCLCLVRLFSVKLVSDAENIAVFYVSILSLAVAPFDH